MSSDGQLFTVDMGVEMDRMAKVSKFINTLGAYERRFTEDDALNVANFGRLYMGVSPEAAAAVAEAGIMYDTPMLADIFKEDQKVQDGIWDNMLRMGKASTRGIFGVADTIYDNGIGRLGRTGINAYQGNGENLYQNFQRAGSSFAGQAARDVARGNDIRMGDGWTYGPTPITEYEGFGDQFVQNVEGQSNNGVVGAQGLSQAYAQTEQEFVDEYGYSTVQRAYESQEATIVSKTRNGKTYATPFSPGRAAAVQVFTPGTVPFNIASGSIDGTMRVGWDPLNVPAAQITKFSKARKLFQPMANGEIGIVDSWRPFTKPKKIQDWLTDVDGSGGRLISYLREGGIAEAIDIVGDLPNDALRKIARASDDADVIEALAPHMGIEVPKRPRAPMAWDRPILGGTFYGDGVAAGMVNRVVDSPVGRTYKMLADTTDALELDPTDPSRSMSDVNRRLQAWGVDSEKIEPVLWAISDADGDLGKMGKPFEMIANLFEDRLLTKRVFGQGYTPTEVKYIMNTWIEEQQQARRYFDDMASNPVLPPGSKTHKWETPNGTKMETPVDTAHLDSEFSHRSIWLPSGRDTRRALSSMRVFNDSVRSAASNQLFSGLSWIEGIPTGLGASRSQIVLDAFMGTWRNFALLRVGWLLRYLPDEMARFAASGRTSSPSEYLSFLMMGKGKGAKGVDLLGNNMDDVMRAQGLGAASFVHGFDDVPVGQRFDASRVSWGTAKYGQAGYKRGLAREVMQLNKSVLARSVLLDGIDDSLVYFRTKEGKKVLEEIAANATPGGRLSKIAKDETVLMDVLAEAETRVARLTGGNFVYKKDDIWVDAYGKPIEMYENAKSADMLKEVRDRKIPGRSKMRTKEELRTALIKDDGYEVLLDLQDGRNFYVTEQGSPRARKFLTEGVADDGTSLIKETMDDLDMIDLEEGFPSMVEGEGFDLPPATKVPNPTVDKRLNQNGGKFVNGMFRLLGQVPTETLVRQPFAASAYSDELARLYMFADGKTRRKITNWTIKNKIEGVFKKQLKRQMSELNIKKLPQGGTSMRLEDMDFAAKAIASEQTKALFYDLAKKSNWADMSRLIFPFGDAWWEVIQKWNNLLNPIPGLAGKDGFDYGRRLTNLRRGQQAMTGAQRSGWFSEDQYGNEVFTWAPRWGSAASTLGNEDIEGARVKNNISLSSLMFVDPSDPGNAAVPGFGPPAQVLASLVSPLLPTAAQASFNSFIFGDFEPPERSVEGVFDSLAPSWLRKVKDLWFDEADRSNGANLTVSIFEVFSVSEDPMMQINSKEDANRVLGHAQDLAGDIRLGQALDGLFGPSQTYEAQFWASMPNNPQAGFWMSERAIGNELRIYEEFFGDEQQAYEYVLERFGIDSDKFSGSTSYIRDYPTGKDGYEYLVDNPKIGELFPITMMMFISEEDDVEFYRPAYKAAKEMGARVPVTPEMAPSLTSKATGNRLYESLSEQRDNLDGQLERRYGEGSNAYRDAKNNLDSWFEKEVLQLGSEFGPYWAWGYDSREGDVIRPSFQDAFDEVSRAGGFQLTVADDGVVSLVQKKTETSRYAEELNPELYGFIEYSMARFQEAQLYSVNQGNKENWWASSTSSQDTRPQQIRDWFIGGLQQYVEAEMTITKSKIGAQYITENIFTGLIEGADFESPFIVFNEPPGMPANENPLLPKEDDLIDR